MFNTFNTFNNIKNIVTGDVNNNNNNNNNNKPNLPDKYKGSYKTAFNIFSLGLTVSYLTDYNIIPLIIGLNGLHYHMRPTKVSRAIDMISNAILGTYIMVSNGDIVCYMATFIYLSFFYRNHLLRYTIDDTEQLDKRHRYFVQIPAMFAVYCGIKGY